VTRFDRLSRSYERLNPYTAGPALAKNLELADGMTVVDVGGGTGQVAAHAGAKPRRWVVADPSEGMLAKARDKGGPVVPVRADAARLPFKDHSVDRVVFVDALHHVPDQEAAIREIVRVLRPDGRAVVQEFRMDSWWRRLFFKATERLAFFGSRFDGQDGWRSRFEAAGLSTRADVVSWSDVQFVLRPRPPR
jgi:demethylmenaquinone methyltransferase/2-methoxy-6-polyprenyl-1,4-benzoquinol methylase